MYKLTDELVTLHDQIVARRPEATKASRTQIDRENTKKLRRLSKLGIRTLGDLLCQLPTLSVDLKNLGVWLISCHEIKQAANVLIKMLPDAKVRLVCASALGFLGIDSKIVPVFLEIGKRELSSNHPDASWLAAVVHGLKFAEEPSAAETLATIFERQDLPGGLRGDAGDALGCQEQITDRRTTIHRRCRDAALRGLTETNIEVKFWSMYVLGSIASRRQPPIGDNDAIRLAIPHLKKIAKRDHRLSPGYWWPMSAEAEDVIHCIEQGSWPDPDAGERWIENTERGARELR